MGLAYWSYRPIAARALHVVSSREWILQWACCSAVCQATTGNHCLNEEAGKRASIARAKPNSGGEAPPQLQQPKRQRSGPNAQSELTAHDTLVWSMGAMQFLLSARPSSPTTGPRHMCIVALLSSGTYPTEEACTTFPKQPTCPLLHHPPQTPTCCSLRTLHDWSRDPLLFATVRATCAHCTVHAILSSRML